MAKLKSQVHHWWPRCVSKHWADNDGSVGWLRPDGTIKRLPHHKLGGIGNGHHIKFDTMDDEGSAWDQSFENEFDQADSNFPKVIEWIKNLPFNNTFHKNIKDRYTSHECTDTQLKLLAECVASLVVRSPKFREQAVSLAEQLRGKLSGPERNALIGLNMRSKQTELSKKIGLNAKYSILFSPKHEFIFGDGFYNNISGSFDAIYNLKILVPLTPSISVLIYKPRSWRPLPRLSSLCLTNNEVQVCNNAVQVYSKESLFFRHTQPDTLKEFTNNISYRYQDSDPLNIFFESLPGLI